MSLPIACSPSLPARWQRRFVALSHAAAIGDRDDLLGYFFRALAAGFGSLLDWLADNASRCSGAMSQRDETRHQQFRRWTATPAFTELTCGAFKKLTHR